MSDLFRILHLRRMRERPLGVSFSILAIASGVALVVSMASLLSAAGATAEATIDLLGGARYEVTVRSEGVDSAQGALGDLDGVDDVRRYVETPVMLDSSLAWLVALESNGVEPATDEARALTETGRVQVGNGLPQSGEHSLMSLSGVPREVGIDSRADRSLADRYGGDLIVAPLDRALELRGPLGTETLLVSGDLDASAITAAVDDATVEVVQDRVERARNVIALLLTSLSVLAGLGLVVGGFVLFNTMNMAVLARHHEIASIRVLGGDRRSLLRGVLLEALLLGIAGSTLGVLLGALAARYVVGALPDAMSRSIGTPMSTALSPIVLLGGWVLGITTAMLAAYLPARHAVRVEPLEALRPVGSMRTGGTMKRRIGWVALGAVLMVLPTGLFSVAIGTVGFLMILAGLGPLVCSGAAMAARVFATSGELARNALLRAPRRVWSTTSIIAISVAIVVTTTGLLVNISNTMNADLAVTEESDFWISTATGDSIALVTLPSDWLGRLEALPGVESVAGTTWRPATIGDHIVGVQGVYGDSSYYFSRLAGDAARQAMGDGEGVIVTKQTARTFDLDVGDVVEIPGAVPALELPLVGITNATAGVSGGLMNISHDLFAERFGVDGLATYEVQLAPGADSDDVQRRIDEIVAGYTPAVQVFTGAEFRDQLASAADQIVSLIAAVLMVVVACAAMAVLNTLLASTMERTREIATIRALGGTRSHVVRSITVESIAMGVTGGIIGAAVGAGFHAVFVKVVQDNTAFSIHYAFSPLAVGTAIGCGIVIAVLGALLPARRAARMDILEALSA
ncbi:MAG: FtsX-like permease family protein [Microthrixaceae bacterium]